MMPKHKIKIKDLISKLSELGEENEISKRDLDQLILNDHFPEVTTIEEIEEKSKKYAHGHLRVGFLKERIKDLPDNALVLVERVEDIYYEENCWSVVLREGESYGSAVKFNNTLSNYLENYDKLKDEYPNLTKEYAETHIKTEEELEKYKDQYTPVYDCSNGACVEYGSEYSDALYLFMHY